MRIAKAQELESTLSPEELEIWRVVSARLLPVSDFGLELYLLRAILGGATVAELERFMPKHLHRSGQDRRQHFDRRELAAGER